MSEMSETKEPECECSIVQGNCYHDFVPCGPSCFEIEKCDYCKLAISEIDRLRAECDAANLRTLNQTTDLLDDLDTLRTSLASAQEDRREHVNLIESLQAGRETDKAYFETLRAERDSAVEERDGATNSYNRLMIDATEANRIHNQQMNEMASELHIAQGRIGEMSNLTDEQRIEGLEKEVERLRAALIQIRDICQERQLPCGQIFDIAEEAIEP